MAATDIIAPALAGQILTFKVRAFPTRQQHARFADYLAHTRQLYNAALEERVGCYQKTGRTITKYEQSKSLTELRQDLAFAAYPRRMQRWAINLVDAAYRGLFTRHRKGARGRLIGFPRYRSPRPSGRSPGFSCAPDPAAAYGLA